MKTFIAIQLSGTYVNDRTKGGFSSYENALDYVKENLCESCKKDIEKGYIEYDLDFGTDRIEVLNPLDTHCGAEWIITEEEDYKEYGK